MTYKSAGVDIKSIKKSQAAIGRTISKTYNAQKKAHVEHGFGHYAGIVKIKGARNGVRIATHTDGVGTKVMIANDLKIYDTVGIDCIAMNVNDIICTGATPISFVNYIAASKNDTSKITDIVKGLAKGAKKGTVPIVGGETAIMPGLFGKKRRGFEFDLAGTVVGMINAPNQGRLQENLLGSRIKPGDVITGAFSTGMHSNGYTLARKALAGVRLGSKLYRGGPTVGDALLEPTEIYVKPILDAIQDPTIDIHGLAHITGGSFTKLLRLKRIGFDIECLPDMPRIIKYVMEYGNIKKSEMYSTFNMGIGFCVISPVEHADAIRRWFSKHHIRSKQIGVITPKAGVTVESTKIA